MESPYLEGQLHKVTPLAGVWIEIAVCGVEVLHCPVTPLAGVWIEIGKIKCLSALLTVTPLAGVWIEILVMQRAWKTSMRHSPCGSVD